MLPYDVRTIVTKILTCACASVHTFVQAVKSGKYRVAKPVKIVAPITGVGKIVCIGMNYVEHCTEQNMPVPTEPVVFNKFPNTICGSGEPIDACAVETQEMDFEVELAGAWMTPRQVAMFACVVVSLIC